MSVSGCVLPVKTQSSRRRRRRTRIDVARTTLVAIEQGQRRARMIELQKLAKAYGTSVNALLRQEAIHVDFAPRFRKLIGSRDAAAAEAAELMANLARAEAELENLLGVRRAPKLSRGAAYLTWRCAGASRTRRDGVAA